MISIMNDKQQLLFGIIGLVIVEIFHFSYQF